MAYGEAPEVGHDELDSTVPRGWMVGRLAALLPARRAALGLGASATPSLAFIALGVALGPAGLRLLTLDALERLDPVVSVALAMLGVFVGLGLAAVPRTTSGRPLLAATLEITITILVVALAMYVLLSQWGLPLPTDVLLFSAVLGLCSAASAAMRVQAGTSPASAIAARIADLDDVPLIALGALVVAVIAAGAGAALSVLLTAAAGAGVGLAGWLLFERAESAAERGVFVTGAIVLLGGVGAYLGASPLLSGVTAALVWVRAPGATDRIIAADLRRLQHPLVALLLVIAGASIQWHWALAWVVGPLVLLRWTGKLLASTAAAAVAQVPSTLLATILLPPGVIGIALALNIQQALGTGDMLLLSSVTMTAVLSELLAAPLLAVADEPA